VDFLCPDITQSWKKVGGAICEVNAQPGFRVHWLGDPARDLEGEIVEGLFKNKSPRIPTTAITGTNGKSTTAQMMHHIWLTYGKASGVCTTQGVWIEREQIRKDNLSGHPGAKILLADPLVEAAVIELPRKGLIYFGHPCDKYDVGALLNIQNDHIGEDGVQSLEAMAQLKAEVLQRAEQAIVINADDPLCLAMRAQSTAKKHILVARSASNPVVAAHIANGECAVFIAPHKEAPWIYIADERNEFPVMPLRSVPATMEGLVPYNELNALSATALAWAHHIPVSVIADALGSFKNSHELNPGRFNFIEGYPFRVLLDYAHNPDGVKHVCEFIEKIPAKRKLAVIFQIGNRSARHIESVAPVLAHTFDYFVIGQDKSLVEKCPDYQGENPGQAMFQHFIDSLIAAGARADAIVLAHSESEGVEFGLAQAEPGDLLSVLTEEVVALPLLLERASRAD
jgi:cyanophycin synthetase